MNVGRFFVAKLEIRKNDDVNLVGQIDAVQTKFVEKNSSVATLPHDGGGAEMWDAT